MDVQLRKNFPLIIKENIKILHDWMVHKETSTRTKTKPCKKNERWKTFNVQYIYKTFTNPTKKLQ